MLIYSYFSVPGCPRDDLHRVRFPHDVPASLRVQQCGREHVAGRHLSAVGDISERADPLQGRSYTCQYHNVSNKKRGAFLVVLEFNMNTRKYPRVVGLPASSG